MFFRSLSLVTLSILAIHAQDAAPAPAGAGNVPPPMVNPPVSADAKPNPDPAALPQPAAPAPAPEPEKKIAISLPKATGNDIAQFYRQLTGKRVLVDSKAAKVEANIVVFGDGENKEDAIRAFEKALLMNGLAIVPSGTNEVKLLNVTNTAAQNPHALVEGIPVIMDEADIPDGDNIITFVMPLQYIIPDEALKMFKSIADSRLHSYGSMTAVPNASVLIITENASLIKSMIDLKNRIDLPSQQIANKWIQVKYADVESLAETLVKITQPQQNQTNTARQMRMTAPVQVQPAGGKPADASGGASGGAEVTPPQIIPDPRTNRLLLLGRPMDLFFLETLVAEFDIATDNRNSLRRKLKYLAVLDFLPVAQNALERMNPQGDQKNGQPNQMAANGRNSTRNSTQQGGSSSSGASDMLKNPEDSTAPDSLIVGRTLLVGDTITNSIVVQGPPQSIEAINELLDQIDVRGPQVMISTIFGQFRRTDDREFGLDWVATLKNSGNFSWAGSDFNSSSGWNPTTAEDPKKLSGALSGLSLYGKFGGNINFLLRAAMDTGKFSVLSRPTVYTVNNQRAVIESGQKIAVPQGQLTGVSSNGDGLTQSTSIAYRDIVLRLEVIPLVNSEKEVTLQVGQLNDQITGYQKIGGTDGTEVPTIATQKILTTVTVPNGGTVILGGLITKDSTKQKSGIPILSDIPLLGWAFSSEVNKVEEREIVIFIQPSIIYDEDSAYKTQVKERSRYQISPQILDFAEPVSSQLVGDEGLLPYNTAEQTPAPDQIPAPTPQAAPAPANDESDSSTPAPTKKRRNIRSATRAFGNF